MQYHVVRATRFVRVEAVGRAEVGELVQMIRGVAAATRERGDRLALFNLLQVQENMDSTAHFALGEQVALHLTHLSRLASVVPAQRMTRTSEKVARAQGVQLRVFDAEPAALAWLLDEPQPAGVGAVAEAGAIDSLRAPFWESYRHLFPAQAQAVQLASGSLVIAWPLAGDPQALFEMSTPITVRFEPELIERLKVASPVQRRRIAASLEVSFRSGMLGYDPYAAVPQARVIVLG